LETSWQLVGNLLQAWSFSTFHFHLHVVIDLSSCQHVGSPKKLRTSWQLVGNPSCQPGLATSFQLVRIVGCGLYHAYEIYLLVLSFSEQSCVF